jgi:hypothetical protein
MLGEAPMRVSAQLNQEEASTPAQFAGWRRVHAGRIPGHLAMVPHAKNCF